MRVTIIAAVSAALLFILITLVPTQAATKQQRRYHFRALRPQWNSYARSNSKEHILRTANDAAENPPQNSAETGRGFMAKWMMFKSMLQPTQPPANNVIVVTAPGSSPTAPTTTTTTITSPTLFTTPTASTITTPTTTTTTATNSTRNGHLTQIVYGRGENNDYSAGIVKQKGQFEYTNPGVPNQNPTMGQFPRPRRRIHRGGQLNRNKQKRRTQQKRKASRPNRNMQVKRRRNPMQAAIANRPPQHKTQRRKVVRPPNQNHIANRNDNFVANKPDAKVDFGNNADDSAGNYLDTNSRLQNVMMNGLRHSQTPIVYNH